jgi:hydrogenase large subunit
MTRIVIDPVARIEGHLRIEAQVEGSKVTEAWCASTMFRGMELVLRGQDPRDAWTFAQRMCGSCATAHALCSVRAVENALNIRIPENARLIRNIMAGMQHIQDHVIHFYHLHALDWVDIGSALDADPARTARLAQSISDWPLSSTDYFGAVRDRVASFVQDKRLDNLETGYRGHPAYKLPPEASLMVVAHYLQALDWQRDVIRIQALCGTKDPHPQTYRVGGMACPVDANSETALTAERLALASQLFANAREFVEKVYIHDVVAVGASYKEWASYGAGPGNYLACGDFPLAASVGRHDPDDLFLPGGIILNRDLSKVHQLDRKKLTESWFEANGDDVSRNPRDGRARVADAESRPPPMRPDTEQKYGWLRSPRYDGGPMEVGPLARMLIAYASDHARARFWVETVLAKLEVGVGALLSTLGRVAARSIETAVLTEKVTDWLDELAGNMGRGDLRMQDTGRWGPETWPREAVGFGWVEAPRGALGHRVQIEEGSIAHYLCLVPSGWNASPRDAKGQRGPLEAALLGTPVADPERPIEILRTIHSFDPCMVCAVHVTDPRQREITRMRGKSRSACQPKNGERPRG